MSKKILLLCGFKGTGKDSVAKLLGMAGYQRMAFADPLKEAICAIYGYDPEMIQGNTPESREWREQVDPYWEERTGITGFTPREALTFTSTDVIRRYICDTVWVDRIINDIRNSDEELIVITDYRFPIEYSRIKEYCDLNDYDFKTMWVKRDVPLFFEERVLAAHGDPDAIECMKRKDIHESEYLFLATVPDYVLDNTGTLNDTANNLMNIGLL